MTERTPEQAIRAAQHSFVLEWGRMSSSWGINPTMAQIHALLFITGEPMAMDDIIDRLGISRGNASMNLRDLMDWRVVQRFRKPGDRRDTYVADTDPVTMISRVVRERKRREIDPTVEVLKNCLHLAGGSSDQEETFRVKVQTLLDLFDLIDAAFKFAMANDERSKWLFQRRDEIKRLLEQMAATER
ncbi:MAG: MarR family transcriptional regulator [Armatimonadota bacterium]|nr:MarR family transcriptional regulator [Armatimonadota bacterium]